MPFAKSIRLLSSVLGIGIITAVTLMVKIDDIVRFNSAEHLATFIGLVPCVIPVVTMMRSTI